MLTKRFYFNRKQENLKLKTRKFITPFSTDFRGIAGCKDYGIEDIVSFNGRLAQYSTCTLTRSYCTL